MTLHHEGELRVHSVLDDPLSFDHAREIVDPDALDAPDGLGRLPHGLLGRIIEALVGLRDHFQDLHDAGHVASVYAGWRGPPAKI